MSISGIGAIGGSSKPQLEEGMGVMGRSDSFGGAQGLFNNSDIDADKIKQSTPAAGIGGSLDISG